MGEGKGENPIIIIIKLNPFGGDKKQQQSLSGRFYPPLDRFFSQNNWEWKWGGGRN